MRFQAHHGARGCRRDGKPSSTPVAAAVRPGLPSSRDAAGGAGAGEDLSRLEAERPAGHCDVPRRRAYEPWPSSRRSQRKGPSRKSRGRGSPSRSQSRTPSASPARSRRSSTKSRTRYEQEGEHGHGGPEPGHPLQHGARRDVAHAGADRRHGNGSRGPRADAREPGALPSWSSAGGPATSTASSWTPTSPTR